MSEEPMEKQDKTVDTKETGAKMSKCPCCQHNTLQLPVKLDDTLLDHYMACMLTGTTFWRQYELYNGRLFVVAQLPETKETLRLSRLATLIRLKFSQAQAAMVNMLLYEFRRMLSIREIRIQDNKTGIPQQYNPAKDAADLLTVALNQLESIQTVSAKQQEFEANIQKWQQRLLDTSKFSGVPRGTLDNVLMSHLNLYNSIVDNGFDENFYSGIVLG